MQKILVHLEASTIRVQEVPLVDAQDHGLAPLEGIGHHLRILVRHSFGTVQQMDDHVPGVHRAQGAAHAVPFHRVDDPGLAPNARRVRQTARGPAPVEGRL